MRYPRYPMVNALQAEPAIAVQPRTETKRLLIRSSLHNILLTLYLLAVYIVGQCSSRYAGQWRLFCRVNYLVLFAVICSGLKIRIGSLYYFNLGVIPSHLVCVLTCLTASYRTGLSGAYQLKVLWSPQHGPQTMYVHLKHPLLCLFCLSSLKDVLTSEQWRDHVTAYRGITFWESFLGYRTGCREWDLRLKRDNKSVEQHGWPFPPYKRQLGGRTGRVCLQWTWDMCVWAMLSGQQGWRVLGLSVQLCFLSISSTHWYLHCSHGYFGDLGSLCLKLCEL